MNKPFISICTPTYNRREFIPLLIKNVKNQTFPQNRIEWLIYDDGTDKINDLVETINNVRYFYSNEKKTLGYKRNFLDRKAKGNIIIVMDDDDIYSKKRVEHVVNMFENNINIKLAACSETYILFKTNEKKDEIWKFGPYHPRHGIVASFAYRIEILNNTQYNEEELFNDEDEGNMFLKNFSFPTIQLDPLKTILVIAHNKNNIGKKAIEIINSKQHTKIVKCDNVKEIIKYYIENEESISN